MARKLTSSDDPPALTNGSGMPLVGSRANTTLMFSKAWNVIATVRPSARKVPNRSGALSVVTRLCHAITRNASRTITAPIIPSSSATTA